ncbi:MAG: MnhB domain-containing protein [Acholeplasmataceae bacterium]
MTKKLLLVPLLGLILFLFVISLEDLYGFYDDAGRAFFSENVFAETGSRNFVTAIYLDYRLFDSLFEAGILLIAVSGVMWISKHTIKEKNANFMLDKYRTPELFITFSRLLYPIMLAFGLYVIINGHLSPGGGFQGGAIVATAILILYYIDITKTIDVRVILTIEKILFILLVSLSLLSIITRDGRPFTNFIASENVEVKAIFLMLLNVIIGAKVSLGLVAIFTAFLKEGR